MVQPVIAQKGPYVATLEPGEYYWCACGRSTTQPFCNGLHRGTEFNPKRFTVAKAGKFFLCGCKHSSKKPFCDRTHRNLG